MISVTVKRLPNRTSRNLSSDILDIPVANALAEAIAKKLAEQVREFKCEDHPQSNSRISVEAVKGGHPKINKGGICCSKLADRIQVTFTK